MSIPSNGITPEVIRESMTPYLLSQDLLHATFAALPAPPPGATPAWRRARVTRLAAEIVAPMPANADQACISAQSLIFRELANTFAKASQAPKEIGRWHFTCRPYAAPTLLVRDNDTHIPEVACQNSYAERDPPA